MPPLGSNDVDKFCLSRPEGSFGLFDINRALRFIFCLRDIPCTTLLASDFARCLLTPVAVSQIHRIRSPLLIVYQRTWSTDRGPTTTVAFPDEVVSSGSFLAEKSSGGILPP